MRFAALALHDPEPDAKTDLALYREQMAGIAAVERSFARFDALRVTGCLHHKTQSAEILSQSPSPVWW
jgi:hypothetical protein